MEKGKIHIQKNKTRAKIIKLMNVKKRKVVINVDYGERKQQNL